MQKHIKVSGKKLSAREREKLAATTFGEVFPKILADPACVRAGKRMTKGLPTPAARKIGISHPVVPDEIDMVAVTFGLCAGGVVLGVVLLVIWAYS